MSAEEQKPHEHGENCQHDHDDHDHDDDKGGKGEKKIKKALLKLGLNKVEGVNRVTIRQKDNYILVVKDPEVYVSKESDSSYVIFGEITIDDPDKPKNPVDLPSQGPQVTATQDKPVQVVDDDDNTPVSEEGLEPENIEMIITETKCSRPKAVKALRKHNGDVVNAILELNS